MKSSEGAEFTDLKDLWRECACGRAKFVYGTRCPLCVAEPPKPDPEVVRLTEALLQVREELAKALAAWDEDRDSKVGKYILSAKRTINAAVAPQKPEKP